MIIAKNPKDTKGGDDQGCPWGWNILEENVRNNKKKYNQNHQAYNSNTR